VAKTNAARILDTLGVAYELRSYEVDLEDLSAVSVAAKVGLPPEQVFKTLVARGDRHGICLALVPGDEQLDLKALARATGDRRSELVALREVLPLTGYVRGGVTALACKKDYPVLIDETARLYPQISVSAGARGLQILLAPDDYARAVHGRFVPLTGPANER
jgi:Cys-tRNA(Pro)/Cys-tRNA(Cys) deacylase